MKRLLALCLLWVLLPWSSALAAAESFAYGQSVQGRDLICWALGEEQAENRLLLIFGVHGFEDAYDRDGQTLYDLAQALREYYAANPEALNGWRLYLVPSANPDGLAQGDSNDGFGRCNADGLNINRDFPVWWKKRAGSRNRTGDEPFATPEARALRELVQTIAPTYGVDVHGWTNGVYGDKPVAECFRRAFDMAYRKYQSGGMLSQWMSTVTQGAALLELPASPSRKDYQEKVLACMITALELLMEEE